MLAYLLHKRAIVTIWLMAIFLLIFSLPLLAANGVGKILFVHGSVEIFNATGEKRIALKDGDVFKGDRVVTAPASSLQIQMSDSGYFAVRPNSEFVINEYIYNQSETDRVETSIIRGGLRSITGAIGQKNKKAFRLKTPVATIGIRGTDLVAFYLSPQMASPALGQQGSYLTIQSGAGVLETAAGAQVVAPGQAAYVASANLAPTSISQLPGIFQQPTFEEIIPGVNDQQNQEEAKEEPKEEEQQEEEEQKEEEQKEEEQNDESSDDEDKFEFKAHAYLGKGKSSYVLQNYDLGDDDATNLYLPMLLVKETPYEEYGAGLTSIEAGVGGVFRPISMLEIYGNLSFRNQAVDTDVNVEHADTDYDISGGRFNFGAALNASDILKVWVDVEAEGYDNSSDHFYDAYDLNVSYEQRYNAYSTPDPSLAALPAYEADRVQLGASLDVGTLVGIYGTMSFNRSEWDAVLYDGWNNRVEYVRQGVYTDLFEGGVRFNPVLIPIDFYASTLVGDFGSEGDDHNRYFNGSVKGVKGRVVLNQDGVFSLFGSLALLNFEGDGGYYNPMFSDGERSGSYAIDSSVRQAMAGVELRFTDYLMLQGFAQAAQSVDNINPDEKDRGAGAFELRIRAEL